MAFEFGKNAIPDGVFTKTGLSESASSIIAERRAYAKFTYKGTGLCPSKEKNPDVTIESGVTDLKYERILSGPRLVPPPSLTSVDWSSDGANDIYDGYLWKATVNFTCYSPSQFNNLDTKFFQHFNDVSLTLGWITGGDTNSVTVNGVIVDFQFSMNEKGHYDCSVTFAGSAIQSSAAFDLNLLNPNTVYAYEKVLPDGRTVKRFPQSIVGYLKAFAQEVYSNVPFGAKEGMGGDDFGRAKFILNTSSWLFWSATKDVHYVSLTKLIETINANIPKKRGFQGITLDIKLAHAVSAKIKSANPLSVLNQNRPNKSATYAVPGADFTWSAVFPQYFISFDTLEKIEKELIEDKSDNPHSTKNTLIQFIKRVLDEINSCLGECINLQMIPYGQSGESSNHGYEITDRKSAIKSITAPEINPHAVDSTIRSLSVQSTMDSEMASIALSSAHSGKNQGMVQGVFGCAPTPPNVSRDKTELATMYASFVELNESKLLDCVQILKKVCNVEIPQVVGYRYGVTVTITADGYAGHLFGKVFKLTGLPTVLTRNNVYFIVLKQGHKFSNGDWTMDLEGQMMFDMTDTDVKPIKNHDPVAGVAPNIQQPKIRKNLFYDDTETWNGEPPPMA